jgi:hypothetical protein
MLAPKKFPQVSVPQSLTIWGPLEVLEDSIVSYANIDRSLVRSGLDAATFRPEDTFHLDGITTPFVPLLISLGNGLVLRPVSSIMENPFLSILALDKWRNPKAWGEVYRYREEWMRSGIYGLFQGTRYRTVDGNIKLREGNSIVTDIDAAVLDTVTGELALFQIKWQDYYTNDVRELRSRAANLTKELDEWAEKVQAWLERQGKNALTRALRLRLNRGTSISGVYLFGISRSFARMRGFGFTTKHERLAVANWPLFVRTRYRIGPASRVFNELFDTLRMRMDETVMSQPLPFTITVGKESVRFEDLWNVFDAGEEESL